MAIDPTKLANVRSMTKPAVCAYWLVQWDPQDAAQDRYYSDQAYDQLPPFLNVGVSIEPRILGNIVADTQFEINPDLRTETIPLVFQDIDKAITTKFQTYKSGIRCELFYFYPSGYAADGTTWLDVDLSISVWFGQLQAPRIYGHKTIQTVATNGFRSREQLIPKRMRPRECTANFGGLLPSTFAIQSNGCPYDRHLGGIVGDYKTGTTPYADCPRLDISDCLLRLPRPTGSEYYLGFNTDASATVTDTRSGYVAVTKGNESALKQPIRMVFGQKYLRGLQLLLWRREINNQTPDHGWVRGIWEVCEGPVQRVYNVKVIEKIIELSQQVVRYGGLGQPQTGYAAGASNFSGTAHFMAAYGWVNPLDISVGSLSAECNVIGYELVAVLNNTLPGQGLIGQYYSDTTFSTLVATNIDPQVNFPSSSNPPLPGMQRTNFSIRWTGQIKPQYSETYTFTGVHDDSMKLVVNAVTIFDEAGFGTHTGTIALTADTLYDITVEMTQSAAGGTNPWECILKWSSASQAIEVVPTARLFNAGSSGYLRQWTDSRVWALMEVYTNQRMGMANPLSRFTAADWVATDLWSRYTVSFTLDFPDGETEVYTGRRTTFDAALEGRPVAEQIEDICRSGALSVPFQHEGKYTITPFRKATSSELSAARVFTDTGSTHNIIWADGQPAIYLEQIPDDKIVNEITLTFEEESNKDVERPITVDDPDQKLKAGRLLGEDNLQSVPKRYAAFGCRYLHEVIRLGYRFLRFGEFDEGGTQNNLRAIFTVPFEQALGVKRYEIIKVVSALLNDYTVGKATTEYDWTEPPQYFRVLQMFKQTNGTVKIIAQAYNDTAYTAFEVETNTTPGPPQRIPGTSGGVIVRPPIEPTCPLQFNGSMTYDSSTGSIRVPVDPC